MPRITRTAPPTDAPLKLLNRHHDHYGGNYRSLAPLIATKYPPFMHDFIHAVTGRRGTVTIPLVTGGNHR